MATLTLPSHTNTSIDIDVCDACQVIWFDRLESLRLAPAATLKLFQLIGTEPRHGSGSLSQSPTCPRCHAGLQLTADRQRNTPFHYWRCPAEHGRLTTFLDFLREKDFIRPLTPQQIAELRRTVQTIQCSNCGGPIDLVNASVCGHCGTPVSILDVKHIREMTEQVRLLGRWLTSPTE